MPVTIKDVIPGSPAHAAGLRGGMQLCSVNGSEVTDGLDYEFFTAAKRLVVAALDGENQRFFKVEKAEYEPFGCTFESYLITPQHHCKNRCVFCFIDQLPGGMRPSLYFKDDDERLGFLFGNYITLTNLSPKEVDRIIAMRFSPVNLSVHTVNPDLRVEMMGNPLAGQALAVIPRLADAGIEMNFQLVLVPGLNDGEELVRSIRWLAGFAPLSIAAVPVGLTRHRQGLPRLNAYTAEAAAAQLDLMLAEGDRLLREAGSRTVYPADEWFLLAGRQVPDEDFYEGYPQLENGVGMWRLLEEEFTAALGALEEDERDGPLPALDIATGLLAAPLIKKLAGLAEERCGGGPITVHPVENRFFGSGVTVAGLLTGQDITSQLEGRLQSGRLLITAEMLRAEGDVLLDDVSPEQLGTALGTAVQVVPRGGEALLWALLGE